RPELGSLALHVAGDRPGVLHHRLRRPDLPRGLQGHPRAGHRAQHPARLAPALGRSPPRLGLRLLRPGDVPWDAAFRALRSIGYEGPISIEWEDAGMDRLHGAKEALEVLRSLDYPVSEVSFDAAFSNQG